MPDAQGAKIFISHSSKTPEDLGRVFTVYDLLASAQHEPLLDKKKLQTGSEWYPQLIDWGRQCHVAVLLLTSEALKSPYVLFEAFMFRLRLAGDSRFQVIPVLVDGLTVAEINKTPFAALQLGSLHLGVCSTAEEIRDHALKVLRPLHELRFTPEDELVRLIGAMLSRLTKPQLTEVLRRLGAPDPPWVVHELLHETLSLECAHQLIDHGVRHALDIYDALEPWSLPQGTLKYLFDLLAAFWARSDAAEVVRSAAASQPKRAIAVNGQYLVRFTARAHVRRAEWPRKNYAYIPVQCEGGLHELDELKRAIDEEFGSRSKGNVPLWLKNQRQVYVVLPAPDPAPEHLAALRREYENVTFILGTAMEDPEVVAKRHVETVPIAPPIEVDDEEVCEYQYQQACDMAATPGLSA